MAVSVSHVWPSLLILILYTPKKKPIIDWNDFEFIYGDRSLDGIQMGKNALSWLAVSLPQALNSTLKSVSYCGSSFQSDTQTHLEYQLTCKVKSLKKVWRILAITVGGGIFWA